MNMNVSKVVSLLAMMESLLLLSGCVGFMGPVGLKMDSRSISIVYESDFVLSAEPVLSFRYVEVPDPRGWSWKILWALEGNYPNLYQKAKELAEKENEASFKESWEKISGEIKGGEFYAQVGGTASQLPGIDKESDLQIFNAETNQFGFQRYSGGITYGGNIRFVVLGDLSEPDTYTLTKVYYRKDTESNPPNEKIDWTEVQWVTRRLSQDTKDLFEIKGRSVVMDQKVDRILALSLFQPVGLIYELQRDGAVKNDIVERVKSAGKIKVVWFEDYTQPGISRPMEKLRALFNRSKITTLGGKELLLDTPEKIVQSATKPPRPVGSGKITKDQLSKMQEQYDEDTSYRLGNGKKSLRIMVGPYGELARIEGDDITGYSITIKPLKLVQRGDIDAYMRLSATTYPFYPEKQIGQRIDTNLAKPTHEGDFEHLPGVTPSDPASFWKQVLVNGSLIGLRGLKVTGNLPGGDQREWYIQLDRNGTEWRRIHPAEKDKTGWLMPARLEIRAPAKLDKTTGIKTASRIWHGYRVNKNLAIQVLLSYQVNEADYTVSRETLAYTAKDRNNQVWGVSRIFDKKQAEKEYYQVAVDEWGRERALVRRYSQGAGTITFYGEDPEHPNWEHTYLLKEDPATHHYSAGDYLNTGEKFNEKWDSYRKIRLFDKATPNDTLGFVGIDENNLGKEMRRARKDMGEPWIAELDPKTGQWNAFEWDGKDDLQKGRYSRSTKPMPNEVFQDVDKTLWAVDKVWRDPNQGTPQNPVQNPVSEKGFGRVVYDLRGLEWIRFNPLLYVLHEVRREPKGNEIGTYDYRFIQKAYCCR